ncbi:G2/mitotic-specific cyclin-A [Eupeodes corollae]|uniref:G2/mitotic-specific cyclin-A n=1 Tax=Eupeodes corollae TaxID=290404 RepID=UPI00249314E5|nr:G2/mitotic-specific cyclin-A [Eupeodes corollae]XP_055907253.1 G2/mitotic-specific cyclin-A [Eupeodes corollae]
MATFKIHQDTEKENAAYAAAARKETTVRGKAMANVTALGGKDKRFAVLSSSGANNSRPVGGGGAKPKATALRDIKVGPKNDENAGIPRFQQQQKKFVGTTPVEQQFQAFSVYEDEKIDTTEVEKIRKPLEDRKPLQEVPEESGNDSMLETPMSITDALSPMSIDRSQIIDDDTTHPKRIITSPVPKNDRERFFEVVEYQNSILEYFRESEKKHRPKPTYMKRQPDINNSMRTILVDWLVEVAEEYKLDTETLYLAVSYIDRFLSQMSVVRGKLQLVGTAAMYIASKYEEIYPPDVAEFVFITDDTYTKGQVLRMEQIILKILSFDLCIPTSYAFLNTYAVLYDMPHQVKFLAQYISELSLLEGNTYLVYLPSLVSAAALALARYILDFPIWCPELEEVTSYKLEDMKEIIVHLSNTHMGAPELAQQAIPDKYKDAKYWEVSTIKGVALTEEAFDVVLEEHKQMLELQSENSLAAASATDRANTSTSNESVRKMISSLMFV